MEMACKMHAYRARPHDTQKKFSIRTKKQNRKKRYKKQMEKSILPSSKWKAIKMTMKTEANFSHCIWNDQKKVTREHRLKTNVHLLFCRIKMLYCGIHYYCLSLYEYIEHLSHSKYRRNGLVRFVCFGSSHVNLHDVHWFNSDETMRSRATRAELIWRPQFDRH